MKEWEERFSRMAEMYNDFPDRILDRIVEDLDLSRLPVGKFVLASHSDAGSFGGGIESWVVYDTMNELVDFLKEYLIVVHPVSARCHDAILGLQSVVECAAGLWHTGDLTTKGLTAILNHLLDGFVQITYLGEITEEWKRETFKDDE